MMFKKGSRVSRSASFSLQGGVGNLSSSGTIPSSSSPTSAANSSSPSRRDRRSSSCDEVASPPPQAGLIETRLSHLEKDLAELREKTSREEVKAEVAQMYKKECSEQLVGVMQRVQTSYEDIELLKEGAEKLMGQLRDYLAQVNRQQSKLQDMLNASPNMQLFPEGPLRLRVGECVYVTSLSTLTKEPSSMLAAMFSGKFSVSRDHEGCFFIDRDGELFQHILSWLRTSRLPKDLSDRQREELLEECDFFGIERMAEALRVQGRAPSKEGLELYERNTVSNIQAIATGYYVQSVIASLAEVTHLVFRQMAADAELGAPESVITFTPGMPFHEFFVASDGSHKKTLQIFMELMRQEGASCIMQASGSSITFRCNLLRPDKDICMEVLKNFKKMRGLARN